MDEGIPVPERTEKSDSMNSLRGLVCAKSCIDPPPSFKVAGDSELPFGRRHQAGEVCLMIRNGEC